MRLLQRRRVAWPPRRRRRIPFVTDRGEQRGLGSGQVAGARCPLSKRAVGLVGTAVSSSCRARSMTTAAILARPRRGGLRLGIGNVYREVRFRVFALWGFSGDSRGSE